MLDRTLNSICARAHRLIPDQGIFKCEEILLRFPELQADKDLLFEIALEEFRRRQSLDPGFDEEAFFAKFADHGEELRAYVSVHQALESESFLNQMESALEPTPGIELGDYFLLERLGRGAFGQVFLARQLSVSGRLVVVKLARVVEKEVHALSQLSQCQHIVPVYTVSRVDDWDTQAICMPYLGRVTMQDVLDSWTRGSRNRLLAQADSHSARRKLEPPRMAESIRRFVHDKNREAFTAVEANVDGLDHQTISDWRQQLQQVWEEDLADAKNADAWRGTYADWVLRRGIELLEALHEAHRRQLLHCDVKPSNVLVNDRGQALLFDFNLTKGCDSRIGGGTLPYMAPEQLRVTANESGDDRLTVQTDLFAWGVTVIQMLSGELPFGGFANLHSCDRLADQQAKRLLARQKMGRDDWGELLEPLPPKVASLIVSAIAFEPSDRPESARSLALALREAIREGNEKLVDRQAGSKGLAILKKEPGESFRKPIAFGVSIAALLLVCGGLVWMTASGLFGRSPWSDEAEQATRFQPPEFDAVPKGDSPAGPNSGDEAPGVVRRQGATVDEFTEEGAYRLLVEAYISNQEIERFERWSLFAQELGFADANIQLERSFHDAYNLRFSDRYLLKGTITVFQNESTQGHMRGEITLEDRARMIVNEWDRWLSIGEYYELSTKYTKEDIEQVGESDIRSSYYHCLATKDLLDFVELISERLPRKRVVPVGSEAPQKRRPEQCLQSAREHLGQAFDEGPTTTDIYLEQALLLLGEAYLSQDPDVGALVEEATVAIDQVIGIWPDRELEALKQFCRDFPRRPADDGFRSMARQQIEEFNDHLLATKRRFSNRRNATQRFRTEFERQAGLPWNERHKLLF